MCVGVRARLCLCVRACLVRSILCSGEDKTALPSPRAAVLLFRCTSSPSTPLPSPTRVFRAVGASSLWCRRQGETRAPSSSSRRSPNARAPCPRTQSISSQRLKRPSSSASSGQSAYVPDGYVCLCLCVCVCVSDCLCLLACLCVYCVSVCVHPLRPVHWHVAPLFFLSPLLPANL